MELIATTTAEHLALVMESLPGYLAGTSTAPRRRAGRSRAAPPAPLLPPPLLVRLCMTNSLVNMRLNLRTGPRSVIEPVLQVALQTLVVLRVTPPELLPLVRGTVAVRWGMPATPLPLMAPGLR